MMPACLNDKKPYSIQQSTPSSQIKGVAEKFYTWRPITREKNGHHIKTGGGLCQVVARQILHGDPADLKLFPHGDGLGGMTEPVILSGFHLNKNKDLRGGCKNRPFRLLGDNINFSVMIPVIPLKNAISGILKVLHRQVFTPPSKEIFA